MMPLVACLRAWLQRQRNFGDSHMNPRLVASNDDRVLAIRDAFFCWFVGTVSLRFSVASCEW
jgi:hypothetical protein